jgi:hypothetical protein
MKWPRLRRDRVAEKEIADRLESEVDRLQQATVELELYVRELREVSGR